MNKRYETVRKSTNNMPIVSRNVESVAWVRASKVLIYSLFYLLSLLSCLKYIEKKKIRYYCLTFLFFIVHVGVALHLISISRFAIVADRYVYVSCIGFAFLLSYFFVTVLSKEQNRKKVYVFSLLLLFYVCYLGAYANFYSRQWKDTDTLKENLRELLKTRKDMKDHPLLNLEEMKVK